MEYLFSLKPNQTLSEGIKALSKFQISGLAYSSIVERGYNYFRDGEVYPNIEISVGKYELEVSGNYGDYEIVIQQEKEKVNASCDCPYDDGTCKHIIASLLHLQNNVQSHVLQEADITAAVIAKAEKAKSDFEKYVDNLPIAELRKLVLEFAPENFRKEVTIKKDLEKGDTKKVEAAFSKLRHVLLDIFDDETDLYLINNFEAQVAKASIKLRPYWNYQPDVITDMICEFHDKVCEAFDDNYLYEIDYQTHDERSYEGEYFATYIAEFIAAIPRKNQEYACSKISERQKEAGYGFFDNLEAELQTLMPKGVWLGYF